MKTIICPNYLKGYYLNQLLANQETIFDIKLMPIEAYAYNFNMQSSTNLLLQAKQILTNIELNIFKPMLKYPKFIQEVLSFTQDLILYNQDIEKLPEDNPQEQELKKIIKAIYHLDYPQYQMREIKLENNNVESLDYFCNDIFSYNLKKSFTKIITLSNLKDIHRQGRYALNIRQEIESVAQDIVNKNNAYNTNIILCDYQNQLPILKQIFNRYQIPFTPIIDSIRPNVILHFTKLVNFMLEPTIDNLKECLFNHCFAYDYPNDLYIYFDTYISTLDDLYKLPNLEDITILNNNDLNNIQDMANRSLNYFLSIKEQLDQCINVELNNILPIAYEITKDINDINATNKIASIINESLNMIKDIQDIIIINKQIESITIDNTNYQENSIIVTDLTHPIFAREYAYILGCTSKTYPNFSNYDGIFDEDYLQKIDIIPLDERYDLYMQQLNWIHKSANNIYYSYYTNDYANKVFELALEIEELNLDFTRWPLISNDLYINDNPTLNNTSIFFKDDMLYGSISSFERYFNCPYAYFIQYGLKINQSYNFQIEANIIGTIMHAIMEKMIKIFNKDYAKNNDKLKEISQPYFVQLNKLFPKEQLFIKAIQERMIKNLELTFTILNKMESETSFSPYKTEYKFQQQYNNLPIMIKGTIDRIDINHNYFRIIDYKSSAKKLQEKKIQAGLQLQLMTYLILGEKILDKTPVGAYYFSLKNENIKVPATKISRNKIQEIGQEEINKLFIDNKKLEGITISHEAESGLDYGDNIKNAKLDPELIKECLDYIYNYLLEQLKSGNISISPSKDGCRYCQFQNICLNKNQGEDHIIFDKPLKAGKGEEDEI